MSELRKYATPALFYFPIIEDGDADFATDYTPAAGDAKVWTDLLISTTPTSLILGFDSLSEIPAQGAQINEQGAGTAEGVVEFTVITSGTVGGGDAAGFFFMRSVTGQGWTNNDVIDIDGGTTSMADADSTNHDLATAAGLIGVLGNGQFAACLSSAEMTCAQGSLFIVDSATKACEDQAIRFHTYGNAAALHAIDFDDSVRAGLTALPNVAAGSAGGLPDDTDSNGAVRIVDGTGAREINTNSGAIVLVDTTTTNTDMVGTDNAALASVLGALDDSAAVGDVTTADTVMQYAKQLLNEISGSTGIGTMPSGLDPANGINLFEMLRAAMGDTFATSTDALDELQADNVALQTAVDAIPTTAMRGTDNAALASVLGALNDASAVGDVTTSDTVMQYVKQLLDEISGGTGIGAMPALADPANGINLFEMLRAAMGATFASATDSLEQLQADHVTLQSDTDDIQLRVPTAATKSVFDEVGLSIIEGTVDDASATTTAFATDGFTEATDDHFNGRLITFTSGILIGQQTDITDYDAADGTQGAQEFTVTALTEAPGNNDTFIIH